MANILYKEVFAQMLKSGIGDLAAEWGYSIKEAENKLASLLSTNARTLQFWKNPATTPDAIADDYVLGFAFLMITEQSKDLTWLVEYIQTTDLVFYDPPSPRLVSAYFRKVYLDGKRLEVEVIDEVLRRHFPDYGGRDHQGLVLHELLPLEPISTRALIEDSQLISVSGLSLFRFIPAFYHDFVQAVENGTDMRVLLVNPKSSAVEMMGLRSASGFSEEDERIYIEKTLELLNRMAQNTPESRVKVRVIDYMPPYGLTIFENRSDTQPPTCLVRLFAFRSPTPNAPALSPNSTEHSEWFEFFREQFEKMWGAGHSYNVSR